MSQRGGPGGCLGESAESTRKTGSDLAERGIATAPSPAADGLTIRPSSKRSVALCAVHTAETVWLMCDVFQSTATVPLEDWNRRA